MDDVGEKHAMDDTSTGRSVALASSRGCLIWMDLVRFGGKGVYDVCVYNQRWFD